MCACVCVCIGRSCVSALATPPIKTQWPSRTDWPWTGPRCTTRASGRWLTWSSPSPTSCCPSRWTTPRPDSSAPSVSYQEVLELGRGFDFNWWLINWLILNCWLSNWLILLERTFFFLTGLDTKYLFRVSMNSVRNVFSVYHILLNLLYSHLQVCMSTGSGSELVLVQVLNLWCNVRLVLLPVVNIIYCRPHV